jgi:hypothetical protein
MRTMRDIQICVLGTALAGLTILALLGGCGQSHPLEDVRQQQFASDGKYQLREAVAKFAGRVTVDGKPPKRNCRLFVILNDPQHFDETAEGRGPGFYAACDPDGNFAFKTYEARDGVLPGKYVVTFVELHRPFIYSSGPHYVRVNQVGGGPEDYRQPDELKNLYNDPNKNANDPAFNLELEPPGQVGYHFDLAVAAKKPVEKPGPNAVVGLPPRRRAPTTTSK